MLNQFVFANNIKTTLAVAVNSTATVIQLSSSANLPTLGTGQIMPITLNDAATGLIYEIMYCTAISGSNLTVSRGEESTSAQSWNVGDIVFSGPTAGSVAAVDGNPNQSFYGAPAQYENQFVTAGQLQNSSANYAVDTGSPNVYQIALTPAITGLSDGLEVRFKAANPNNGPSSLAVNGFSASLTQIGGNPLFPGEIVANGIYSAVYNLSKTRFELTSTGYGSAVNQNTSSQTGIVASVNGTTTAGHITTFNDTFGTIEDNGLHTSSNTQVVSSVEGTGIVVGHLAEFSDSFGTIKDSGVNVGSNLLSLSSNHTIGLGESKFVYVASASITLTVPVTTSLFDGFTFSVSATSGNVLVTPNAADKINGIGASYTVPSGTSVEFVTDGAGNINTIFQTYLPGTTIAAPTYVNSSISITGGQYLVDTSGGAFSLNLPAGPSSGMSIRFIDAAESFNLNNLTLIPGGTNTINGSTSSLICDVNGVDLLLWYKSGNWSIQ